MSNLLRSLIVRVGADLTDFDKNMKAMSKQLKTTGKELTSTGESLTKGLTLPIAAAAAASIKYASDMGETLSKTKQTFKGSADDVLKWSETSLTAFGLAKASALDMAATYGDMGTAMLIPAAEAAEMSKTIVGLTSDVSSFKNVSTDQTAKAMEAIYTGQGEALKTLGYVMQDSTLNAFALAHGYKQVYSEMEQDDKVRVRYKFMLEATKNAQGDFARTSDSTANQMRITAESAKEAAAAFGQNLLPAITPLITKLNEGLKAFSAMDDGQKQAIATAALFAAGIGPVTMGLGKLTSTASGVISSLGKASKAIQGGGGLVGAITAMIGPAGIAVAAIGALAAATAAIAYVSTTTAESVRKSTDKQIEAYRKLESESVQSLEKTYESRIKYAENAIAEESKLHEQNLKNLQETYFADVKAAENKNREIIKGINKEQNALNDAHNERIQQIQNEYGVVATGAKSRSDIVIERYEAEADAARAIYDEKVTAAESAYNSEAEAAKQRYNDEVKAAQTAYEILDKESKKRYEAEKKLAENRYDEEAKKYKGHRDSLVKEAKTSYDADVKAARAAYEERTKAAKAAYDIEVDGAKKAHSEKMALLDAESNRSQDRIDRASSLAVGDLEDRIALLDGSTTEEVAIERKKRQEQRAIELEGLIAAERDETEKAKLISERAGIIQQIVAESANKQVELQRWAIREQILSEKQKAADLKETEENSYEEKAAALQTQLDEQLQTLTDSYNKQSEEYQNNLDAQLAAFEEFYDSQVTQLDALLDETIEARKAALDTQIADLQTKLDEETAAHKTALNNQTTTLDEQLKTQLESFQTNLDNKKTALDANLSEQLAALEIKKNSEITIIQEERIAKEATETKKYEAAQESLDKQLEAQDTALDDANENLKKDYEQFVTEAEEKTAKNKQELNTRLEDLKTELEDERKAIQDDAEKRIKQAEENAKLFKNSILGQAVLGNRDITFSGDDMSYSPTYGGSAAQSFMPKNMPAYSPSSGITQTQTNIPGAGSMFQEYFIPSYDIGTNYVPRDGLAMLHQGEGVLTAADNAVRNSNGIIRESPINITNNIYTEAAARTAANEFGRVLSRRGYPEAAR